MNKSRSSFDKKSYNLPNWLWSSSNSLPQFYKIIWEAVKEDRSTVGASQGELLVDTNRVFPLLLTSQLPTEVLGYIWSLANQKYAGQLTELELYIVLALIAVAQTSYPFTSLDVLHMLPGPPTPRLNLSFLYSNQAPVQSGSQGPTASSQRPTLHGKSSQAQVVSKVYQVASLQGQQTSVQSLQTSIAISNVQTTSPPKAPSLQIHSGMKSYPAASSALGLPNPLQSHQSSLAGSNLQSPQLTSKAYDSSLQAQSSQIPGQLLQTSIISSTLQTSLSKAQSVQAESQIQMYETIVPSSIINSSYISESKLSVAHKSSSETSSDFSDDFTDFQSAPSPHQPSLPNIDSKQGSAIGSRLANHNLSGGSSMKKLGEKTKKSTQKLKTTCLSVGSGKEISSFHTFGGIFPKSMVKNQTKTVVLKDTIIRNSEPVMKSFAGKRDNPSGLKSLKELSGLDLMNLHSVEDKYSALRILVEDPLPPAVEKVEEIQESENTDNLENKEEQVDDFGDFVSAEQTDLTSGFSQSVLDASMDLFSDFEQFLPNSLGDKEEISFAQETIEALAQLEITASPEKTIDFLEEKYETVIDPEKIIQKEDTISINSIELTNGPGVLTRSGSVPSLDLKLFLPSNGDEEKETENMHQLIYWEWKQYMESCVLLLQVAVNIFTSINSEVVLQQVLNSAQGYNFLCNLAEVAAVCRRVNFSHKEMDINIMGFDDLLLDIDRIWAEMEPFYVNIPIVTELPVWPLHQGETNTCALCLTVVTSGRIIYNENTYHATCANLWLNCVNSNLPALKYPPHAPHAVSAGGN